jgi:hypothetical protein
MATASDIKSRLKEEGFGKMAMSETWNFDEEEVCQGVLVSVEHEVGDFKSNMYTLETKEGKRVGVWGSTVIDSRLKNATLGQEIVIWYKGKVENPKSGRKFKNYEVYCKDPQKDNDK